MSGVARAHDRGVAQLETERRAVTAARLFTLLFAVLMVLVAVAFAAMKVRYPSLRIIPVVLGIAGYVLGPMLGVFLLGIFTRNRGNDTGNVIAIAVGLATTITLGMTGAISFTWFALVGAMVVLVIGLFFKTPDSVLIQAEARAEQAKSDDRPMSMRD